MDTLKKVVLVSLIFITLMYLSLLINNYKRNQEFKQMAQEPITQAEINYIFQDDTKKTVDINNFMDTTITPVG